MSPYQGEFRKPQILECPSCGATLSLPDADSFECDYCGKRILIPPELRPQRIAESSPIAKEEQAVAPSPTGWERPVQANLERSTKKPIAATLAIVFSAVCVLAIGGLVGLILISSPQSTTREENTSEPAYNPARITPLPTMVQFARPVLVFGSKGNQPGQFDDARSIAVDPQGNIFVADYTSGRINKFDSQGNFLSLIQVEPASGNEDVYIFGIATDEQGNLFVSADGSILTYSTTTGELLATIPNQWPDIYYESVVAANGNLYSTNGMAGADEVIILSTDGNLLAHWMGTIEAVNHDDPRIELALGVNSTGMVYILSPFGSKVYVYNPDGTFNFSFGQEGDSAGQFSLSTGMLAITSQDYVVVSDVYRVDLFDAQGNYLGKSFTIDYNVAEGSMFGMTIDSQDDLYYISSGGKVLKFDMNYP